MNNALNTERTAPDSNIQGETASEQEQPLTSEEIASLQTSSNSNSPTLEAFNAALKLFEYHQEGAMTSARACAEMGLIHFYNCGDTSYMARFLLSMRKKGKNYTRSAAYVKWALDFAPVDIEVSADDVKITKNKLREAAMWADAVAKNDLLEKACSITFWEHAPDKEVVRFGKLDLLLAIKKTVEKFEDEKKYVAGSAAAKQAADAALAWIDSQLG